MIGRLARSQALRADDAGGEERERERRADEPEPRQVGRRRIRVVGERNVGSREQGRSGEGSDWAAAVGGGLTTFESASAAVPGVVGAKVDAIVRRFESSMIAASRCMAGDDCARMPLSVATRRLATGPSLQGRGIGISHVAMPTGSAASSE